jgi:hypothetical protein
LRCAMASCAMLTPPLKVVFEFAVATAAQESVVLSFVRNELTKAR